MTEHRFFETGIIPEISGWDMEGYAQMLHRAGYIIHRHETVDTFQVVLAEVDREIWG